MEEIWRTIDWRPLYEVSNLGRVRNRKSGKILATNPTKSHRHPQVWLYSEYWQASEQFTLSHIVYNAFKEDDKVYYNNGRAGQRIGHYDGDITNNKIENLYRY
jgi:hypothetical protein